MFGTFGRFGTNPFSELQRLQRDINRAFSGLDSFLTTVQEYPPLNVLEDGQDLIVTAELPGMQADTLDISVANDALTLSGSREPEVLKEDEIYHRQERTHGHFSRTIRLPFSVDAGKVQASYRKGILTVVLPRAEEEKPKKITIKAS